MLGNTDASILNVKLEKVNLNFKFFLEYGAGSRTDAAENKSHRANVVASFVISSSYL